jgi:hypothetical protein
MASFSLFPLGSETIIQDKLKKNEIYTQEIEVCNKCDELYEIIRNIKPISIAEVLKKIEKVPCISSKDLSRFLENTLTSTDIKWAVIGYNNQKNKDICPMCGQRLSDKQAICLF